MTSSPTGWSFPQHSSFTAAPGHGPRCTCNQLCRSDPPSGTFPDGRARVLPARAPTRGTQQREPLLLPTVVHSCQPASSNRRNDLFINSWNPPLTLFPRFLIYTHGLKHTQIRTPPNTTRARWLYLKHTDHTTERLGWPPQSLTSAPQVQKWKQVTKYSFIKVTQPLFEDYVCARFTMQSVHKS